MKIQEKLRHAIHGKNGYGDQLKMAEAIGVKRDVISRWLCGTHRPRAPFAWAIEQAFLSVTMQDATLWKAPWVGRKS